MLDSLCDFAKLLTLEFRPIDDSRYPCLRHAREAMRAGGTAPAIFNAANEVAVAAFLAHRVGFLDICRLVERALTAHASLANPGLDDVLAVDREVRTIVAGWAGLV